MAKRKIKRKHNKSLIDSSNLYSWGGDFNDAMKIKAFDLKGTFSGGNVANMLKNGLASAAGSAIGKIGGNLLSGGLQSGAGSAISGVGSTIGGAVGAVNPILGGIISAGSGILGGATNALFGSKLNQEKINKIESSNSALNSVMVDNSNADSIENQWANQTFGSDFSQSDIGKDGLFSSKAKSKYNELKLQQDIARNRALTAYDNAIDAADTNADLIALANFSAYGGPLNIWGVNGSNTFAKGGKIHIKKANRGKFTKYCGGNVTSECIAKGKKSNDPAVRKRATFAQNARKWHHAFGGELMTNGAEWDNGLSYIGNGGTHEDNPNEGVQMGVDSQGIPNLVEEGEVVFNDYVFSNRLTVPKAVRNKYKLRGNKDITFADAAKKLAKESEERPNDPISKRGRDTMLSYLMGDQEEIRMKKKKNDLKRAFNKLSPEEQEGILSSLEDNNVYAIGGPLGDYTPDNVFNLDNYLPEWNPIHKTPNGSGRIYEMGISPARLDTFNVPKDYGIDDITADEWTKTGQEVVDANSRGGKKSRIFDETSLRYAPVLGAAIGLGQNLFSRPDYSNADAVLNAANDAGNYIPVDYDPIGNYLQYKPLDRNYYINRLDAQAGATRRAIMNSSSPSRNAALLAADYNAQGRLGDLARQAEEYNLAQREKVETFNRGTNMANSEMGLKAAMANQDAAMRARSSRLSGVAQAMAMRDAIDARRGASVSANLTNLFDNIGNIGWEAINRNMVNTNKAFLYDISRKGDIDYKGKQEGRKQAKGGYLTIKKRRRNA